MKDRFFKIAKTPLGEIAIETTQKIKHSDWIKMYTTSNELMERKDIQEFMKAVKVRKLLLVKNWDWLKTCSTSSQINTILPKN